MLLGIVLMIAEAFVPSFGALGLGGIVAFVIGSVMLIDTDVPGYGIPWALIVPVAVASALFSFFVAGMAIKARARPVVTGAEEMIGAAGEILEDMEHEGWARVHSEQWRVRSSVPLKRGSRVRVRARHDLMLDVEPRQRRTTMFEFGGLTIVLLIVALLAASLRILREYERGVVFMLGRFWKVKGPGLVIIIPGIQQMVRVDLRTVVFDVPSQDVISRDNVSVKVNAVVYFRVIDPAKSIMQVEDYLNATSQLAQTTLRAVLGKHELDEMLAERETPQPGHPAIARRADRRLGHQGLQRRDQARRHRRIDGARHRQAGRGRARAARQGDPRRRRTAGLGKAAGRRRNPRRASRRRCSCAICRRSPTSPATRPTPSSSRCRAN